MAKRVAKVLIERVSFKCAACGCGLAIDWNETEGLHYYPRGEFEQFNDPSYVCEGCGKINHIPDAYKNRA